jgi:hypothetical protein
MKAIKSIGMPLLSLSVVLAALLAVVNRDLPKIGHDYGYHIPRMLDGYLHLKVNGFEIQWYTPSFGGGLPAYPNPQDIQYSLPQLLMFAVNPWASLMISLAVYSALGFLSFYLLLKEACGFGRYPSMIGSMFILANGFFVQHAVVGHVGFQVFPLLGVILYLLFSRRIGYLPAGILVGGIGFLIVNQSGFYIAFIFCLALAVTLPLMYLLTPHLFDWRRIGFVFFTGGLFAAAFSASKITAVYSFMRFFPREIHDIYTRTYLQGLGGIGLQLLGGMAAIPYLAATGNDLDNVQSALQRATGSFSGVWETDISISPILTLILAYGIIRGLIRLFQNGQKPHPSPPQVLAMLALILGAWLVVDFSLAKGWLFDLLKPVPIIRSLHVNVRYVSAFIFPLSFAGAYILDKFTKTKGAAARTQYLFLGGLTVLFLLSYLIPSSSFYRRSSHINCPLDIYAQIEKGERFPVARIENLRDINVFDKQASNLKNLVEPVFGYGLEYFQPQVHPGSVFEVEDGYYNMTNPAGYVFPAENGLTPFERFRLGQERDLDLFLNRRQPALKISAAQQAANWVSMVSLSGAALCLGLRAFQRLTAAANTLRFRFPREAGKPRRIVQ